MSADGTDGTVVGADGVSRCAWAGSTPDYLTYHDQEWGRPVHGEQALFERLTLEAFQSGLSWLTILRKRPAFRAAFHDFDPERVAAYDAADRARLMADAGIVRNARKIDAAIGNAAVVLALRDDLQGCDGRGTHGGLDALLWSHAPAHHRPPQRLTDVPATSPESIALARTLKKRGFAFVGPTTMYAAMQACGLVDDHVAACHRSGVHEPGAQQRSGPR